MPKESVERISVTEAKYGEAIAALMEDPLFKGPGREHERNCAAAALRYLLDAEDRRRFCSQAAREITIKNIATLETT